MLLILSVLGGCKNKIPKTPENFDQDLWRDSVEIMDVLYTTIEKEDNFLWKMKIGLRSILTHTKIGFTIIWMNMP